MSGGGSRSRVRVTELDFDATKGALHLAVTDPDPRIAFALTERFHGGSISAIQVSC